MLPEAGPKEARIDATAQVLHHEPKWVWRKLLPHLNSSPTASVVQW